MTKTITLLLTTIILLSSCGNKFSLVKRKYTKGYYVSGLKKHASPKPHALAKRTFQEPKQNLKSEAPIENVYAKTEAPVTAFKNTTAVASVSNKKQTSQTDFKLTASSSKTLFNNTTQKKASAIKPLAVSKLNKNNLNQKGSDANLIVMIILCLFVFINLIPVYLHDNKSITLNFWITLLLDFTYIGGVIFSLLVVLDIVNLG